MDEEEQELGFDEVLHDGLVYFDSCYKTAQAVTYNKKDESGILMVRSTTQLLHAFIGKYYGFQVDGLSLHSINVSCVDGSTSPFSTANSIILA